MPCLNARVWESLLILLLLLRRPSSQVHRRNSFQQIRLSPRLPLVHPVSQADDVSKSDPWRRRRTTVPLRISSCSPSCPSYGDDDDGGSSASPLLLPPSLRSLNYFLLRPPLPSLRHVPCDANVFPLPRVGAYCSCDGDDDVISPSSKAAARGPCGAPCPPPDCAFLLLAPRPNPPRSRALRPSTC